MADVEPYATNKGRLADLFSRPVVKGLYYQGQSIRLDGYCWENCRFDNCRLEIVSTNFEIRNCIIDNSNQIFYGNEVCKPIKLFNSRFDWAYANFGPSFVPIKNIYTGSISIND